MLLPFVKVHSSGVDKLVYLYLWRLMRILSENPSFIRTLSENYELLNCYVTLTSSAAMLNPLDKISERKEARMAASTVDRCLLLDRVATAVATARHVQATTGGAVPAPSWDLAQLKSLYLWLRKTHRWPLPSMFEGKVPSVTTDFNRFSSKEQDAVCRRYSGKILSKILSLGAFLEKEEARAIMTQSPPIDLAWFLEANTPGDPCLRWLLFHYPAELYEPFFVDVYRRNGVAAIHYFDAIADQMLPSETLDAAPMNGVTKDSSDYYARAAVWGQSHDLCRLIPSKWLSGQPTDVAMVLSTGVVEPEGKLAPGVGDNLPALLLLGLRGITSVNSLTRIRAFRMVRGAVLHLMDKNKSNATGGDEAAVADKCKEFAALMAKMNPKFASKNRGVLKAESNLVAESVANCMALAGCMGEVLIEMFSSNKNRPEWGSSETDLMLLAKFCKCITLTNDVDADFGSFGLDFLARLFNVSYFHAQELGSEGPCANMWVSLVTKSPQTNVPIIVDHILCLGLGDKSISLKLLREQAPLCKVIAQACYGACGVGWGESGEGVAVEQRGRIRSLIVELDPDP